MKTSNIYSIFKEHPVICTDSRKLIKNSIFFGIKGERFNGNSYAEKAITDGCAFAIIDEKQYNTHPNIILVDNVLYTLQELAKYHRTQLKIPIIGITGTNGKTTSKELINSVLGTQLNIYATKGNLNNHIGVPLSILGITENHEIAIIEMGANHRYEIDFLCNICQPTHGIITNIGSAHLEGFGNKKEIERTKNELYKYLSNNNGYLFVNNDNSLLLKLATNINHVTYGIKGDISGKIVSETPFVYIEYNNHLFKTNLIGNYHFENIMLAICVGNYFRVSLNNIKQAIEKYTPRNNRSQIIKTEKNMLILDAYNANPSSMKASLNSFALQEFKNKVCILGDMLELGKHSKNEHKKIVQLCKDLNLTCYFIGKEFHAIYRQSFKTKEDLGNFLSKNKLTNKKILLKGSRGIALEKLVELL